MWERPNPRKRGAHPPSAADDKDLLPFFLSLPTAALPTVELTPSAAKAVPLKMPKPSPPEGPTPVDAPPPEGM